MRAAVPPIVPSLEEFEEARAWTLRDAIRSDRLNLRGRRPNLQLVQRWANPKRGCRPVGSRGPMIVLLTVVSGREKLTMPEWVEAFIRERQAVMVERTKKLVVPRGTTEQQSAADAAMERIRKGREVRKRAG